MDYLDTYQFEAYVSACAANSGVSVRWDKVDATPRTDGKTIWIPRVHSRVSEEWLTRIRYYVKHETSHIVHSDFGILERDRPKGLLAFINNLLEDHRIDYLNDMEYAGDVRISNAYWEIYGKDITNMIEGEDERIQKQMETALPLFAWEAEVRSDWVPYASGVASDLRKQMTPEARAVYDKLMGYTDDLRFVREHGDGENVMALAKLILEDVFNQNPEDYIEEEGDTSSGDGKAETDSKGDEEGGTSGDDVGEGEGVKPEMKEDIITVTDVMERMMHKHESSRVGIHVPHEGRTDGAYVIPKRSQYVILNFPECKHDSRISEREKSILNKSTVNEYVTSNAKPLANKLRLKLQVRSRDRYEYGLKKGKIHNGSLHRLLSGDANTSQRVFRQRKVNDTLDTAITLLVDCSGSMSGVKFDYACAGAAGMASALRPLNLPFSVLGFTNTWGKDDPMVWVFNDFGERVGDSELVDRFSFASGALWENTDGDAIAYASQQLLQRKEKRKVLLVLSDGSPAGRRSSGDIRAYTRDVINNMSKHIEMFGIGICDDNVREYYTNHAVIRDIGDLTPTILSVLDRSI